MNSLRAVALVIVNPHDKILILDEYQTKRRLGKYRGMSSIPMETIEGDENHLDALRKLCRQELAGMAMPQLPGKRIGRYRVAIKAWATLYATSTRHVRLPVMPHHGEVGNHRWLSGEDALRLLLRRGASEMILDYVQGRTRVLRLFCKMQGMPPMRDPPVEAAVAR